MSKTTGLISLVLVLMSVIVLGPPALAGPNDATPTPYPTLPTLTPIAPLPVDPALTALAADYPRVDGSTSTLPLQTLIACQIFNEPCLWFSEPFSDTYWIVPEITAQTAYSQTVADIADIEHNGTHGAYVNLIEERADFILVARKPSADELALAAEKNVTLDVRPVALDAFVFVLNAAHPLDNLALDDIRAIYRGDITTWDALGVTTDLSDWEDGNPIHAYTRNPNSGSQELMEALVLPGDQINADPGMMLASMMGPVTTISHDPAGIGYSVYFYIAAISRNPRLKMSAIDDVFPAAATIADGSYPLTTEVYAVVRSDMPPDNHAVRLRDWLFTAQGQAVIAASGYVPSMAP